MVLHKVTLGSEFALLIDDTVESLLGSILHQRVIVSSVNSLTRHNKRSSQQWVVGNQLRLIIPRTLGQQAYHPVLDLLIHLSPLIDDHLASVNVNVFGPPILAIEICNPTGGHLTPLEHDLDTVRLSAKVPVYAKAGISEYLVFDPSGEVLHDRIRAWHVNATGDYEPWMADPATGRCHSALGISFAPQGVLLRVYDPDGNIVPDNDDMDDLLAARDARIAELEAELRRQRGE